MPPKNRFARVRRVHDAWSLQTAWVMACGAIPWAFLDPDRLRFMVLYAVLGAGFLCIGGPRARPFRRAMLGGSVGVLAVLWRPEWTPSMSLGGEMLRVCFEAAVFGVAGALVLFLRWRFGAGLPRAPASRDAAAASDSVLGLPASNCHSIERETLSGTQKGPFARLRPVLHDWSLHTAWVMACGAIPWAIREPDRMLVMAVYAVHGVWFHYAAKRRETRPLPPEALVFLCMYLATLAGDPTPPPASNDEWITWFLFRQQFRIVLSEMAVFLSVGALVVVVRRLLPTGSRFAARPSR